MASLLRHILDLFVGKPKREPNLWSMTHDEAGAWLASKRQDPAALARRSGSVRIPNLTVATDPVCPYCGGSLGKRKPPGRCSNFKCKACGEQVYAEPKQELFPSVYLTEKQVGLWRFLWQLNHWVYTAGTVEDYYWAKSQINKSDKPNTDEVVSDTIWFLLTYNLQNLAAINPTADATSLKPCRENVTELIQEFKDCQTVWRQG